MMRKLLMTAAVSATLIGTGGQARPIPNTATPQSMQQLIGCRSIADSAQRLACYDREAAAVSKAIASKDLVVIDKARATAAKRSLFGFSIPNFGGLFGGNDNDVKQIESTIASVGHNAEGGWLLKLADGSTWTQIDDAELGLPPERGEKVTVSRGSLGSFYIQLGKQPGFKVKRIG
ncbi:MAG: hypothetical protein ABI454_12230 [Sphingomicrobium sp.]